MRLITILRAQHLDRMFKRHWVVQGQKTITDTGAEAELKARGIPVFDAVEIIKEKRERIDLQIIETKPRVPQLDETHPNYHERKCHFFRDHNVLLEGVGQSLALTKTVQLKEKSLPERMQEQIQYMEVPDEVHEIVKKAIFTVNVFDAEQELLPKVKDPLRPAFNFPRRRGITDQRRNMLLSSKLLSLCEMNSGADIFSGRNILRDAFFSLPLEKEDDLIQFELHADNFIITNSALKPVEEDVSLTEEHKLLDMSPVKPTITMPKENIYKLQDVYPLTQFARKDVPHTIFISFTPTYVHNLYETEVTANQTLGRSMIKSFTVAAAYARKKYGNDVSTLPEPVTVQCVQSDGRLFDFSVFQLNTLNLNGQYGIKNIWYQTEQLPLFEKCCYEKGIPVLEGYNKEIVKYLLTMYRNQ